eukprot:m.205821 g.205821  ORF g.205821 m.205821 type:complete len:362 (+) comp18884_c0_seq1:159-1244(+)
MKQTFWAAAAVVASSALVVLVAGHGAVVNPPPRNAVDKDLPPWNGKVPDPAPSVESKTGWCPVPDKSGAVSGQNGQSCFWFSNGCAIGCPSCDGSSRGPIPNSKDPFWKRKFNVCNNTRTVATICDPALRTVNTQAECGADDDWYYYSPWRAPGSAPVFDSCGMAGGHRPPDGGFGGIYVNTTHAQLGDKGSEVLPAAPSGTVWRRGDVVEVSWTIEANHGGGYQYRLAPSAAPLTEETFQKIPLPFVGQQRLRWGGPKGTTIAFNGTYVSTGTVPEGSTWVVNPIPRNDFAQTGKVTRNQLVLCHMTVHVGVCRELEKRRVGTYCTCDDSFSGTHTYCHVGLQLTNLPSYSLRGSGSIVD